VTTRQIGNGSHQGRRGKLRCSCSPADLGERVIIHSGSYCARAPVEGEHISIVERYAARRPAAVHFCPGGYPCDRAAIGASIGTGHYRAVGENQCAPSTTNLDVPRYFQLLCWYTCANPKIPSARHHKRFRWHRCTILIAQETKGIQYER